MGNMCSEGTNKSTAEAVGSDAPAVEPKQEAAKDQADGGNVKFTVFIEGARGLRNADWWPGAGKSDSYCVLKSGGKELHRTRTISDCLEPFWEQEVDITDYTDGEALEFLIFDEDVISSDSLGKVVLEAKEFADGLNKDIKIQDAGKGGEQAYLKIKIKKGGASAYPDPPKPEVRISVKKGDASTYGLDLDTQSSELLLVTKVKPGPFEDYNNNAAPEEQLKKDDFIMSVNDVTGGAAMLEVFRSQTEVKLVIRRPTQIVVMLDRPDLAKALGVEFGKKPSGNALALKAITEGIIKDYDALQEEKDKVIKVGDFIVAVGGKAMKAA
eukprot:CAMPEP_0197923532 /NCGR_PEP_ID=MMETSP1439-20131203/94139_1 /TAXON_ID=66791 /ORGANISM="Gonyaulax spinifera, Strain CCMP409" /LENGTH=325 /DNA_ID=CAMNT_0043545911 /DNA_START=69 /DNA_END=1043 /DNA_ORIENTATION=+